MPLSGQSTCVGKILLSNRGMPDLKDDGPSPAFQRFKAGLGEFCRAFELGQRHIIIGTAASLDIVMNTHGEICDLTACNPCIA